MAERQKVTVDTTSAHKKDAEHASPQISPVESIEDPDREATELSVRRPSPTHSANHPQPSVNASTVPDASLQEPSIRLSTRDSRLSDTSGPLKKFWLRHVSIRVPHDACRDHLANERTYLGWVRTAVAFSNLGIVVAQLFRLQNPSKDDGLSFHHLGRPMGMVFVAISILINVLGGWRFWRQQNAMIRGKCLASGWELYTLTFFLVAVMLLMFAVCVGVEVKRP